MVLPVDQKGTITSPLQQLVKLTSYLFGGVFDCIVTRVAFTLQRIYESRSRTTKIEMRKRLRQMYKRKIYRGA